MPQISYTGSFSSATLNVPDAYFNVTPGPGGVMPAPFGLVGIEGLASWGPVNKTTTIGSTMQALWYGNPVNRSNDLATAMSIISQVQQGSGPQMQSDLGQASTSVSSLPATPPTPSNPNPGALGGSQV